MPDQAENRDTRHPRNTAQHQHRKQHQGDIGDHYQLRQRQKGGEAEVGDCDRNHAEYPDGGISHHHRRHPEHGIAQTFENRQHRLFTLIGQAGKPQAEHDREEQHWQQVALGHRVHDVIRDNAQQQGHGALMSIAGRQGDVCRLEAVQIRARSRLQQIADHQPDNDRGGGHGKEVEEGFAPHPAERLAITMTGDAHHHATEHNRYDDHFHQLDEQVSSGLQQVFREPGARFGCMVEDYADRNADEQADQDLNDQRNTRFMHVRLTGDVSGRILFSKGRQRPPPTAVGSSRPISATLRWLS